MFAFLRFFLWWFFLRFSDNFFFAFLTDTFDFQKSSIRTSNDTVFWSSIYIYVIVLFYIICFVMILGNYGYGAVDQIKIFSFVRDVLFLMKLFIRVLCLVLSVVLHWKQKMSHYVYCIQPDFLLVILHVSQY